MIFPIIYYIIHNGKQKTTFHISLTGVIHDTCRSKTLIQIMNRLGLCISYDEMEKIDTGLAQRTINTAGVNRTPIPSTIKNNVLLHGAMDNFDHDENTPSGIGGSHDTILMVFQNDQNNSNEKSAEISQMPENFPSNKRALDCILPCQKLLGGKFAGRGTILESFTPSKDIDFNLLNNHFEKEHNLWVLHVTSQLLEA